MGEMYVVTGAPSTGKTSVINYLQSVGFKTRPEIARVVLDEKISQGEDVEYYKGSAQFQEDIVQRRKPMEKIADNCEGEEFWLDRGMPDAAAFSRFLGVQNAVPLEEYEADFYDGVFILDLLPVTNDYVRDEDQEDCIEIQKELYRIYNELGYSPTPVPVMPVTDRADFILSHR